MSRYRLNNSLHTFHQRDRNQQKCTLAKYSHSQHRFFIDFHPGFLFPPYLSKSTQYNVYLTPS
jgi:hypothetical protein